MVPRQPFNEMKPDFRQRKDGTRLFHCKKFTKLQRDADEIERRRIAPIGQLPNDDLTFDHLPAAVSSSSRCASHSRTSRGSSKWSATPVARRPTENARPPKSGMIPNTASSVTSSPTKIGRRPLKGSWVINSTTPVALLKPECLISQTHFPGSTSIGAFGRSALISDTAA